MGRSLRFFLFRCSVAINFVKYIYSTVVRADSDGIYVMTYDYVVSEFFQLFVSLLVKKKKVLRYTAQFLHSRAQKGMFVYCIRHFSRQYFYHGSWSFAMITLNVLYTSFVNNRLKFDDYSSKLNELLCFALKFLKV